MNDVTITIGRDLTLFALLVTAFVVHGAVLFAFFFTRDLAETRAFNRRTGDIYRSATRELG